MIKNKTKRNVVAVVVGMVLLAVALPAFALAPSNTLNYLHLVDTPDSEALQFNAKGVYVEQTNPPQALDDGWVILSGMTPLTIESNDITIVLQKESIISVVSTNKKHLKFYLVAGSASFLLDSEFTQNLSVNTPIGVYSVNGPAELFVSSDISELVFSLSSSIDVTNTITRKRVILSPYHYLDLADPFLNEKPISKQTYDSLSIATGERRLSSLLPSASVQDGIVIDSPALSYNTAKANEVELTPEVKVAPVEESPLEMAKVEPAVVPEPDKIYSVYLLHTNDGMGAIEDSGIPYAKLSTLIKWGKSVTDRNLILDAGNTLSGSDLANFNSGENVATLLQLLQYNAIAPSSAEYAFGLDRLIEANKMAKEQEAFSFLAANVMDEEGNYLFDGYKIFNLEGFKVAVIGISAPETSVDGAVLFSPTFKQEGQALVNTLRETADAIVVLGSFTPDSNFTSDMVAQEIDGIDLIIDGMYANATDGGRKVGNTVIVSAGEKLSSVGIVELKVVNDQLDSIYPATITSEDFMNPENSVIAQKFNINTIEDDALITSYIRSIKNTFETAQLAKAKEAQIAADQVAKEQTAKEAVVTEEVAVAEAEPTIVEEPSQLEVQTETSITTSTEKPPLVSDFGISSTFVATKDQIFANTDTKVGVSINPYIQFGKTRLGLQAFFLTSGSLFSPQSSEVNNLSIGSGKFETLRSALRFVDYFYVGDESDNFYVVMDDHTPITFNNGYLVNNLGIASGPYEEKMGLYTQAKLGIFNFEAFVDDMYLNDLSLSNNQNGAVHFGFDILPSFTLGLGSLINTNRSLTDITAYPTIDFVWTLKDTRKLQVELFGALTTTFDIAPFSIATMYDETGATFLDKLPNFQATGGFKFGTPHWNLKLVASAENNDDPMVSYGVLNSTVFSGTRMLEDTGLYFTFAAESVYQGDAFGLKARYQVPVKSDFSAIVPLDSDASTTGDIASLSVSYAKGGFSGEMGIQRVGFMSAFSTLLDFSNGVQGFLSDTLTLISADSLATPYVSLKYTTGNFTFFTDLALLTGGSSQATVGTTVNIGKNVEQVETPEATESDSLDVSLEVGTSYIRLFPSGTDNHYVSVDPLLTIEDETFSLGIGPHFTFDPDEPSLYYHSLSSPYSFSSGYSSLFAKTYDIVTDVAMLIDHLTIGDTTSGNFLDISRENTYSMGPLISRIDSLVDSALQSRLAFESSIDTKHFDLDLYVNDLTSWQLGAVKIGIAPFKNWGAKINLSSVISAKLSGGEKQFDILPTIEGFFPIVEKETTEVSAYAGFTTLLGYDTIDGFDQMFYNSSVPAFIARFNNYMFHAGLSSEFNKFRAGFEVSMQEGAITKDMFNSLYSRERASILAGFDSAWVDSSISTGRTYTASAELGYQGEHLKFDAIYSLPFTSAFALIDDEDFAQFEGSLSLDWLTLSASYARVGLIDATQTLFNSTGSILSRIKTFAAAPESEIRLGASVTKGPVEVNAAIGTYAVQANDGTYNGTTYSSIEPLFSLGFNIQLF
jgi:2',3'-cyclic-nucleotide 2'-phosphodiesterase (5'-nucleotidase family)